MIISKAITDEARMGLTRIKLQPANYFYLHRGKCPLKGCKMASPDEAWEILISIASAFRLAQRSET